MGGSKASATVTVSANPDTIHPSASDMQCLMEKERLPGLCPVNCDHKTCFAQELKTKESDDASEPTSENEDNQSSSAWEALVAFYLPFLLQSLCGGFHMIRYIFVTYVLQTLLQSGADAKLYRSMVSLSPLPSWPPPSLVFLAVLTLTALIIHPDGFTWIALRKLR